MECPEIEVPMKKRDREPTKYKWMRIIEKRVTYVEINNYNEREA